MTSFTPRTTWEPVKQLGAIGLHKGARLHVTHVRRVDSPGCEAVELRLIHRQPDGTSNESRLRVDKGAIPTLVKLLEALK